MNNPPLQLKELEWKKDGVMPGLGELFYVDVIYGSYWIIEREGTFLWELQQNDEIEASSGSLKTIEEVKQAAQEHYTKELSKALEVKVCKWKLKAGFSHCYDTECQDEFRGNTDSNPKYNKNFTACPFCGGLIEQGKK